MQEINFYFLVLAILDFNLESFGNHLVMAQQLLDNAYQYCVYHGYRFTEPRERVLKILLASQKPLGAYEILQRLSLEMNNPKPPTVYRAIAFWNQEGFIHCIDSLKAYFACLHGHHVGQSQFLICVRCDFVLELSCELNLKNVKTLASGMNFAINNCTIEIKGLCRQCQTQPEQVSSTKD